MKLTLKKYEVFHHKAMREILKISLARMKDDIIRNKTIRKYILNKLSIKDTWRIRHLLFAGRAPRMKNNMHSKILSLATVDNKLSRYRQHRTVRDAMVENFNLIVPNVRKDGRIDSWMMCLKYI